MQKGPSNFWFLHVNEWEMGLWPNVRAHQYFRPEISLKGYSSYGADRKLKQSRGNNSKSIKARVVLVCDTVKNCEVS